MNLRRIIGIATLLLGSSLTLPAHPPQRLYPSDHHIHELIHAAYLDAGRVLPEVTYPASGAQLQFYLELLYDANLSPVGEETRARAWALLGEPDGPPPVLSEPGSGFSLQFVPAIAVELRVDESGRDTRLLPPPADLGSLQTRLTMPPFYGQIDVAVRQEPYHGELAPGNLTNIPSAVEYLDFNFPHRAFLSTGGPHWSFQIGRDQVAWGVSRSGALTLSGEADYVDFARFITFYRTFGYSWIWLRLEPWVHGVEELPDAGPYAPPYLVDGGPAANYRVWRKTVFIHRFTFRPVDWLRFTIMESASIGGYQPDLRMLNPFMVMHSHFDFSLMASATSAELTVVPFHGVEAYGQWYMNDFLLRQEADAGSTEPNAMAWLAGAHWRYPVSLAPVVASLGGEFYYADPYVYIRESVLRSFTYRHRVSTNYDGAGGTTLGRIVWHDGFLGSPFGNDSIAWLAFVGVEIPRLVGVDVEFRHHIDGELGVTDILAPEEAAALQRTPTGTPEISNRLTATVSATSEATELLPSGLVATAGLTGILQWTTNVGHESGATKIRGAAALSVGIRWQR